MYFTNVSFCLLLSSQSGEGFLFMERGRLMRHTGACEISDRKKKNNLINEPKGQLFFF